MKRGKRILISIGCAALLMISWIAAVTAKSDTQKQAELIAQAAVYTEDEIYILAAPLLEEAAGYRGAHTLDAEEALKDVYLHLLQKSGYAGKYTQLLEQQMARDDASPDIFLEAAEYYLDRAKLPEALTILRTGAERTGDSGLKRVYEENRYQYSMGTSYYQDVTTTCAGAIQVMAQGAWGLASADGQLVIPCEYDKISTYSDDRAIVQKGGVIFAVDAENNRVALLHRDASDFGNFAEDRASLKTEDGWVLTNSVLAVGRNSFEEIGMFTGGCAPAKRGGKWGLIDASGSEWVLSAEYDDVIRDELGRCLAQDAVFVKKGGEVRLLVSQVPVGEAYEDAHPFDNGWAAVKKNGKWGFIDTAGEVKIDFQFDDALSFGQHLAAVKVEGTWGYVSLSGELVIEPQFIAAKSFYHGSAPVQTRDGWRFITLEEYREGDGL